VSFLPYGTTEGQTAKIALYIADVIRDHGHEPLAVDVRESPATVPVGCDGVIVGASIHMGRHDRRVVDFVRTNRDVLNRLPTAFYSVSLAAHGDTEEAEGYVEQLKHETAWRPGKLARGQRAGRPKSESCYMPNRVLCTTATAAAGPLSSTRAARCRPNR